MTHHRVTDLLQDYIVNSDNLTAMTLIPASNGFNTAYLFHGMFHSSLLLYVCTGEDGEVWDKIYISEGFQVTEM